jgi:hypothetical protein
MNNRQAVFPAGIQGSFYEGYSGHPCIDNKWGPGETEIILHVNNQKCCFAQADYLLLNS